MDRSALHEYSAGAVQY